MFEFYAITMCHNRLEKESKIRKNQTNQNLVKEFSERLFLFNKFSDVQANKKKLKFNYNYSYNYIER